MKQMIISILIVSALVSAIFILKDSTDQMNTVNGKETMSYDNEYKTTVESKILPEIGNIIYEKKGYSFGMEYDVFTDKSVDITIKIANEKVTDDINEEIKSIAKKVIEKNNLNPELFKITITNYNTEL